MAKAKANATTQAKANENVTINNANEKGGNTMFGKKANKNGNEFETMVLNTLQALTTQMATMTAEMNAMKAQQMAQVQIPEVVAETVVATETKAPKAKKNTAKKASETRTETKANTNSKAGKATETKKADSKEKKSAPKAKANANMVIVNGVEMTLEEAIALANGIVTTEVKANGTKKETASKAGKGKGKQTKKNAPTTRAEAIEQWEKENGITEEKKKAYGEAIREITAEMRAENEEMISVDSEGNKTYDDNYYVGRKWKKEFDRRLVARGYAPKYKVK